MDNKLVSLLQSGLWDVEFRRELNSHGIAISRADFYSQLPTVDEVEGAWEFREETPFLLERIFDFDELRSELIRLIPFTKEFEPLEDAVDGAEEFYLKNSQFSFSDAFAYYAMIRSRKPKTIVEIGSGFSSLCALKALEENRTGQLICVEPHPRRFLVSLAEAGKLTLVAKEAHEIVPDWLNETLGEGDFLFVDSTHTVKLGSDCLHIYLRLLPRVKSNIVTHVHDVFLPNPLPKHWALDHQIYWTEQYLLLAFLIDNPFVRTIYGSQVGLMLFPDLMESFMHGRCRPGGGSFWFEYHGAEKWGTLPLSQWV